MVLTIITIIVGLFAILFFNSFLGVLFGINLFVIVALNLLKNNRSVASVTFVVLAAILIDGSMGNWVGLSMLSFLVAYVVYKLLNNVLPPEKIASLMLTSLITVLIFHFIHSSLVSLQDMHSFHFVNSDWILKLLIATIKDTLVFIIAGGILNYFVTVRQSKSVFKFKK